MNATPSAPDATPAAAGTPAPKAPKRTAPTDEVLRMVPWNEIEIRPGHNVRNEDDDEEASIVELAESINTIGLRNRIKVRQKAGTTAKAPIYEVRAGHRRLAALMRIRQSEPEKFKEVPCILVLGAMSTEEDEIDFLRDMIADAESRQLKPIEKARWFERAREHGMPKEQIMRALRITTEQMFDNYAKALELTPETKELVEAGTIPLAGAVDLLRVEGPARTEVIAKEAAEQAAREKAEAEAAEKEAAAAGRAAAKHAASKGGKTGKGTGAKAGKVSGKRLLDLASDPKVKALADRVGARPAPKTNRTIKRASAAAPKASAQEGYGKEIRNAVILVDAMLGSMEQGDHGATRDRLLALAKWGFRMRRDFHSQSLPREGLAHPAIMDAGSLDDASAEAKSLIRTFVKAPPAEPALPLVPAKPATIGRGPGARATRAPKPAATKAGGKKAGKPAAAKRGGRGRAA